MRLKARDMQEKRDLIKSWISQKIRNARENGFWLHRLGGPGAALEAITGTVCMIFAICLACALYKLWLDGEFVTECMPFLNRPWHVAAIASGILFVAIALTPVVMTEKFHMNAPVKEKSENVYAALDELHYLSNAVGRAMKIDLADVTNPERKLESFAAKLVDTMSLGTMKSTSPSLEEVPFGRKRRSLLSEDISNLRVLAQIWSSAAGGVVLDAGRFSDSDAAALKQLGMNLGVRSMIEAYSSGVPLEDVIA